MHFHRFGLAFHHPDNWMVDTEDAEGRFATVTVYSPGGGFGSVSGHAPGGDPGQLAAAVVSEMREEYRELDAEPAAETIGGRGLTGFDLNFYCLDLTNTAQVRTLTAPAAFYLLLRQVEERDWDAVAPVFAAITTSFVQGLDGPERKAADS
jgi:hypothetical protein